ncbi:MAG TPA: hypothetical protein DDZ66_13600 [Firmicutes bacterium]|nr:hypothetical protein [Bacillota bacterium]
MMVKVLIDLYQRKLDLFRQLGKLSASMAEFAPDQLIADDEVGEDFFKLLDERTVIIGQIDELTKQIQSHEEEGAVQEVEMLKCALQEEMIKLQGHNEAVETVVKRSLEQLREETRKLQSGKQSNRAYIGRVRSAEGSFIDKRR